MKVLSEPNLMGEYNELIIQIKSNFREATLKFLIRIRVFEIRRQFAPKIHQTR